MLKNDIWIKKKSNSSSPLITPFESKKYYITEGLKLCYQMFKEDM
jgi:hypothetical protein